MKRLFACLLLVGLFSSAAWAEPSASGPSLGISSALLSAADEVADEGGASRFSEGTFSFQTYGSASFTNGGEIYLAHVGGGWYFIDGLSINLEAVIGGVSIDDQDGIDDEDSAAAYGLDLFFRWHFLREAKWSLYAEVGAGTMWTGDTFPEDGTHQNFTPQAGAGLTYAITDNINLMGGVRWHHVSNASRTDDNPGADGVMVYAGIIVPF